MHIATVDVISANGKTDKDNADAHSWASAADWKHFSELAAWYPVFIMDDITYESVRPKPEKTRRRIVVTGHPAKYTKQQFAGQLEFTDEMAPALAKRLKAEGCERILLVGKRVNAEFLAAGLVDEMFITVEPVLFGGGANLLDQPELEVSLRLVSIKKLNERGTVLLRYVIDR